MTIIDSKLCSFVRPPNINYIPLVSFVIFKKIEENLKFHNFPAVLKKKIYFKIGAD